MVSNGGEVKSATEIMLHAQAEEAKNAHLDLLRSSSYALQVLSGRWADPSARAKAIAGLKAAINRCKSWHSTLPQPEVK